MAAILARVLRGEWRRARPFIRAGRVPPFRGFLERLTIALRPLLIGYYLRGHGDEVKRVRRPAIIQKDIALPQPVDVSSKIPGVLALAGIAYAVDRALRRIWTRVTTRVTQILFKPFGVGVPVAPVGTPAEYVGIPVAQRLPKPSPAFPTPVPTPSPSPGGASLPVNLPVVVPIPPPVRGEGPKYPPATVERKRIDDIGRIFDRKYAEKISEEEAARIHHEGQIDAAKEAGRQTHRWATSYGACPECLKLEALGPVPIGTPFISQKHGTVYGPPLHPSCRCSLK